MSTNLGVLLERLPRDSGIRAVVASLILLNPDLYIDLALYKVLALESETDHGEQIYTLLEDGDDGFERAGFGVPAA